MTNEEFNKLLNELDGTSLQTLKDKNAKYTASSGDALHNFRLGAQTDGSTMAQTVWHYWKKHFVALMDKIQTNDWCDREDTKEKIQDSINYLRFIWAISEEERNRCNETVKNGDDLGQVCDDGFPPCIECDHFKKTKKSPCGFCRRDYTEDEEEYYIYPVIFRKHA